MRNVILINLFLLCAATFAFAQPTNDECTNPIALGPITNNFCSGIGAYTNVGATPSTYGPATCFSGTQNDVWFSFIPTATDILITVNGASAGQAGGTIKNPQVSLYFGNCGGTINQLECQSAPGGSNIVEAYQGGLFVGSTYLIRVQASTINNSGTFQLCLNNYNPPVEPTSDCPQAAILCDKSPFVVQKVTGAGTNIGELNDATCFSNGAPGNYETNSTWFVWTCSKSGTLEFTLNPNNPADDLDFALYRLPNGIGNCSGKELVRCMASGDNKYPSICMGPTGLLAGETDTSEDAGCTDVGDNAWLAPFNMVQGQTYALVVNNFTSTGNGFSVEWRGTGEFLGPTADFTTVPDAVCLGTPVQVFDASTFPIGNITAWKWSFGADAVPQTAVGPGPHTVAFNNPGNHPLVMTLETDLGCKVTDIQTVKIFPDVEVDTLVAAPDCNGTANGAVTINNITSGTPPYQYSWNNGPFSSSPTLENLSPGMVTLKIKDSNNCETDLSIEVKERVLTADPDVTPPLCNGDANGVISLTVTNGKAPVQFDWGSGFVLQASQGGLAAGVYTIQAIDNVLCKGTFTVTVTDHPALGIDLDSVPISCYGAADGAAFVTPSGGVPGYSYTWSDGQNAPEGENFMPGAYTVTVTDVNGCTILTQVSFVDPPDVGIALKGVLDLKCNGVPTGEAYVEGLGGRPPYTFSADGLKFTPSPTLDGLAAGTYWILVKDNSGCLDSVQATITQPPALTVIASPGDTTIELGQQVSISTVVAPFGRPVTYEWIPGSGLDCYTCDDPVATGVNDLLYIVKITDEDGCVDFDSIFIRVNKYRPMYFPNVFKPSSSTYSNDHFTGFGGPAVDQISLMRIFDRWGSLVFEKTDFKANEPLFGWDGMFKGKPVDGVFTWYAKVRFIDQVELQYEGSVTVVR